MTNIHHTTNQGNYYEVYKIAVQKIINDEEQLPSLPSITLKVRKAIADPNSDHAFIAKLIQLDPSLSTLLFKRASSPLYKCAVAPRTLTAIVGMMGLPALENLVMMHSVRSLFVLKDHKLKKLFKYSWKRMIFKAAVSFFLARKLGFKPAEEAMTASILSEIGTLAVLSAFGSGIEAPDQKTYFQLCRQYSKSLSTILLKKWDLDGYLVKLTHATGEWSFQQNDTLEMIDIINLSIYSSVHYLYPKNNLPPITELSAYKKLPPQMNDLTAEGSLVIIKENLKSIQRIITSIKH